MMEGVALSTRRSYTSGMNRYQSFCISYRIPVFPLYEHNLSPFVYTIFQQGLRFETIKVYLCGIQFFSNMFGYRTDLGSMTQLRYLCRAIRRNQGPSPRQQRQPITPAHLRTMLSFLSSARFSSQDKYMWRCVILTAFFGLLRVSEYTLPSCTAFDQNIHLSVRNVTLSPLMATILIKTSKTDPFRTGATIRLQSIQNPLCPVHALRDYLNLRRRLPEGPLFILSNGHHLTRQYVVAFLSLSLPSAINLNTHSFRIGGASTAAASGVPDSIIQIMGRWRSDTYKRYLRLDESILRRWSVAMANTEVTIPWET